METSNNYNFRLATSAEIIGAIIRSLEIKSEILDSRTARHYFAGENVSDERKLEIWDEFAWLLWDTGIVPRLKLSGLNVPPGRESRVLSLALALYCQMWDGISGQIRSVSLRDVSSNLALLPCLRLATIDFSIRIVGLLRLAGHVHLGEYDLSWANGNYGTPLKRYQQASGLSREKLAEAAQVSKNSLDSWLDNQSYPRESHVIAVAHGLAEGKSTEYEERVLSELKRHYFLCRIGDLLAKQVGRETAVDLATHLVKFVRRALDGLAEFSNLPPDVAAAANFSLLIFGSQFVSAKNLTGGLSKQEEDPVWRADLVAATTGSLDRIILNLQYLSSYPELVDLAKNRFRVNDDEARRLARGALDMAQGDLRLGLSQHEKKGFAVRVSGNAEFSARNRMLQASRDAAAGQLDESVVHLRRAIELQPLNAEYHFHLGATLGKLGRVEEAVQECWLAVQLKPDWDLPRIEIGIILVNNGRIEEGHQHLEETAKLVTMTPHLAFSLGYSRMSESDFEGALDLFEVVLKEKPEHAQALDCAAHCCFLLGQTDRGTALAKEAFKHGASDTYRDWRQGKYRKH